MKVTIEMDNLQGIIEEAAKQNTKEVIEDWVKERTQSILDKDYKDIINEVVTAKIKEYITTYIDCYQISVGGGLDGTPIQYYTPREYINKIITDTFRDKKLTTYVERSYGGRDKKEVTFEEFIKEHLNPTYEIQHHMEALGKSVKNEVSALLKKEYDKSLQNALSGVIMDVIMENEAFKNVNDNIKRLGD